MDVAWEMFDVRTLLVLLAVFLLSYLTMFVFNGGNNVKLPPGPIGFPIIGHLLMLKPTMEEASMQLAKKYGDVFRIRLGSWSVVVVNGKKAIRQALTEQFDSFAGRPPVYSSTIIDNGKSLGFSSEFSPAWKLQRKICRNSLHMCADPKSQTIYEIIMKEGNILINQFFNKNGKPFDPDKYIVESVGSIIYQVCYGQRMNVRDDMLFKERLENTRNIIHLMRAGNPLDSISWLRYILPWKANRYCRLVGANTETRLQMIKEHDKTFDALNIRDFTDSMILASLEYADDKKNAVGLTKDHIFANLDAVEGAGFETVANTLLWALLYMAKFPDTQEKVRQEMLTILGDNAPQLSDQTLLPYTEATVLEILRMSSIVPMAIPHCTTKDSTLMGYDIPKGTMVLMNLYSVAFDKEFWGDPNCFRPERFLGDNGDLDLDKTGYFLPFSSGRRRCVGEHLARAEIFLLLTTILQNCRVIKPPDMELESARIASLVASPKPYQIIVERLK